MLQGLKNAVKTAAFVVKANSPALLLVGGIALGVATVVVAVTKSEETVKAINDMNETLDILDKSTDEELAENGVQDKKQGKLATRLVCAKQLLKIYWLPLTLGLGSVACVLGAFGVLSKQKAAIAAMASVVETNFNTYRERVKETYGEQVDYNLMTGAKQEYVIAKDEVTGKEERVLQTTYSGIMADWTAVCFDEDSSLKWHRDFNIRTFNLISAKQYCNDILKTQGWISLNDVYVAYGLPKTDRGIAAGWVVNAGDDYITDGTENIDVEEVRRFMIPREGEFPETNIWLHFNCLSDIRPYVLQLQTDKKLERREYFRKRRLAAERAVASC